MATALREHGLAAEHSDHIRRSDAAGSETVVTWLVPSTVRSRVSYMQGRLAQAACTSFPSMALVLTHRSSHYPLILAIWLVPLAFLLGYLASLSVFARRPAIGARLTLTHGHLIYFPGRHQDGPMQMPRFRLVEEPKEIALPRLHVGFLSVELMPGPPKSETRCLTVFHGSQPMLRLGGSLCEGDLLWLRDEIEEWKARVNPVRAME